MKILSWNVNGLRSCTKKGFEKWLENCDADVVGLQEVRAREEQLDPEIAKPEGWFTHFNPAQRPGYSGVALYSRTPFESIETSIGVEEYDVEGRVQIARIQGVTFANVYFPNGSGKNRDNSRIPYKLGFYRQLFDRLEEGKLRGDTIAVIGDFNTAHCPIDLARPKANKKTSGFRPEEREELDRLLALGWSDSFRTKHPEKEGMYSWWSNRKGIREKNVGWRIDYALCSEAAMKRCSKAWIDTHTLGSDHCPIGLELTP